MKKRPSTLSVKDQILLQPPGRKASEAKAAPAARRPAGTPSGKPQAVSYLPGGKPREEPTEIPRLFIRGFGGSIKLDLRGVGVHFSEAMFAHRVADDSLRSIHIFQGDIVLIEPVIRSLREGDLLLLELDGRTVLRRAVKRKRLWCIESADGNPAETMVLADHALQGVVVGVLRLFTELTPVKFRGTGPNYSTGLELPQAKLDKATRTDSKNSPRLPGPGRSDCSYLPTAEHEDQVCLVESDKSARYRARPNKR